MSPDARAGQPATPDMLTNIPRLVSDYYTHTPDAAMATQQVSFGTSGHRGTSSSRSFNEDHILAISQAICEHRAGEGIDGPLFLGMDTHALSEAAQATAIEVFAANGVAIRVAQDMGYTPTPVVSHAILGWNRASREGTADGVIITPSHNPPADGGFKYNPPTGGPADSDTTRKIQNRANALLAAGLLGVKRMPLTKALVSACTTEHDYITPYVDDLESVIDMQAIRSSRPQNRGGSDGRSRRRLLGAHRGEIRTRYRGGQSAGGSHLLLHARRSRWQDPHGLLLALRHGRADRSQGSI